MAAINQRIPNFLGGVSQQPDFIKFPGQLRVCHNAHPDVTFGLQKRPPGEFVAVLAGVEGGTSTDDEWVNMIRDDEEKYICQVQDISTTTPDLKVWAILGPTADGAAHTVNFDNNPATNCVYLRKHPNYVNYGKKYGSLTIGDYNILANPCEKVERDSSRKTPKYPSGTGSATRQTAFITLNEIAYNTDYVVKLGGDSLTSVSKEICTALEVYHRGNNSTSALDNPPSATWRSPTNPDGNNQDDLGQYVGKQKYGGSDSDTSDWYQLEYEVVVNGTNYVHDYNNSNEAIYGTRYHATVVLLDGGLNANKDATQNIEINSGGNTQWYQVKQADTTTYQTYTDNNAAIVRTPKNIKKGQIDVGSVLGQLKAALESKYHNKTWSTAAIAASGPLGGSSSTSICTVTVIGNGLLIKTNYDYGALSVRGGLTGDSLTGFTNSAQDISKLPDKCEQDYLVKVSNTDDSNADDYWVKFNTAGTGTTGPGAWEEVAEGDILAGFDYTTKPHALINNQDGDLLATPHQKHTFTWSQLAYDHANDQEYGAPGSKYWVDRKVGDNNTNPWPTFRDSYITNLFFMRNRLGMVAGEQVILSQPADYFNFFVNSAISVSDSDPIDLAASDVLPASLNHAIPNQKGVLLFSNNAQFMLFTEAENFGPKTAQIKKMSAYEADPFMTPVDTGLSVMFPTTSTSYLKAWELMVESENAPPKVVEQTRVIPEFIPKDCDVVTSSAQLGLVTFGKKGSKTIYHYKYYNTGNTREQSAWYTWELPGELEHMLYTGGMLYTVTQHGVVSGSSEQFILNRYEFTVEAGASRAYTVGVGTVGSATNIARRFEAALDCMVEKSQCTVTYETATGSTPARTKVVLPYKVDRKDDVRLIELADGKVRTPDTVTDTSPDLYFNKVNLTSVDFAVGYQYTTEIGLPTYYFAVDKGAHDSDADLRIHRMNFQLGVSGPMEFHINDSYRNAANTNGETYDDYIHYESGITLDLFKVNKVPSALYKDVNIPVYKKNSRYDMTIKIPDPFTATIVSASWDGSYNHRRHVRK